MMSDRLSALHSSPLRIVLGYALCGALWIIFSDMLAEHLAPEPFLTTVSIAKGWLFIALTAVLLYHFIGRQLAEMAQVTAQSLEGEGRLQLLGDNLPDSYVYQYLHEADGTPRFLHLSAGVERLHGVNRQDALRDARVLLRQVDPEQAPIQAEAERISLLEMTDFRMELRICRADGEWRWIKMQARPLRKPDGQVLWDGVATDITERKRAEEEIHIRNWIAQIFLTAATEEEMYSELLKVVLEAMKSKHGVVGYIDPDGVLVAPSMSKDAGDKCRIPDKTSVFERDKCGHSSRHRAIREKKANYSNEPSDLTPEGHIPIARHISMPIIFQEEVIGLIQVANRETDYAEKDVQFLELLGNSIIAPILNARLQRDRHEKARRLAEEEKAILENQLRQSQKMEAVGTLAGGIAHDFNNILTAIIGYGKMALMKMPADDPLRHNIECMLQGSDRAARLTRELLLFSRKHAVDRKPVDLNEVVARVEKFLKKVIGEDMAYKTVIHEAPLPILADEHQLEQVLMNLATNARDSMPKGGALTVTTAIFTLDGEFVSAHGYGKPGDYALLTVSDTGTGMDEATQKRIFEPFFTTKEVNKGTGLGLAVVYGIVKQHDGYINVCSEPDKGSTFRIFLPVIAAARREESRAQPEEAVARGTETILLAEDDEMVREMTKRVLTQSGYTVIEAVDGADAVTKFNENKETIQLLMFDLIMPNMNGKEAFNEIQEVRPGIKAIFSSGYAPDTIRRKVSLANGVQMIAKPVSPAELLRMVRKVLDGVA